MGEGRGRGDVWTVDATEAGVRLDKWLAHRSRLGSRRVAAEALLRGRVWVNDVEQQLRDAPTKLGGGERVRVWPDRPGSGVRRGARSARGLTIIFEDPDLLVLNKPAGLLTVPLPARPNATSLASLVADYWHSHHGLTPLAVHRLDRDTSGLVVFARTPDAQQRMKDQFASRTPERVYLAVIHGICSRAEGTWRTWLSWDARAKVQRPVAANTRGGYEAIADYRTVERFPAASLIEVRLNTGKRHQIRVQAWLNGHPLVGERLYVGPPAPPVDRKLEFSRQALHATRLGFVHPRTDEPLRFDLAPPQDFQQLVERLRGI